MGLELGGLLWYGSVGGRGVHDCPAIRCRVLVEWYDDDMSLEKSSLRVLNAKPN